MPSTIIAVVVGLFGITIGSFLNVLIARVPSKVSIGGRSRCAQCHRILAPNDLVPIFSWLALRGKCRYCLEPISWVYPFVELLTAAMFVATWLRLPTLSARAAWLGFVALGIVLAAIDFQLFRLPNSLVFALLIFGLLSLATDAILHDRFSDLVRAILGAATLFLFFLVLRLLSKGGMGFGDVKLASCLGLYLGYLSWRHLAVGTFLGFFLGAMVGIFLMAAGKASRKTALPFGPFMLIGAWLALWVSIPAFLVL